MSARDMLQGLGESLSTTASVKSVFGDVVHMEGKAVIPVARIAYGFGAGFGAKPGRSGGEVFNKGEGGGGGGGVNAYPAGALEITPESTRFIPFLDIRVAAVAFASGLILGALLFRGRGRSSKTA